jgi:hypothetical protein
MRRLPLRNRRRGPVLVVVTSILFVTVLAAPAYANGAKVKTKITSATSLKLQKHGSYYLFGAVTDGSATTSGLQDQLYSVQDEAGFTSAEIGAGPTTTNSFTTATAGHELVGARIPRGDMVTLGGEASSTGPGSTLTTSVPFVVTASNTLVEVMGLGSAQQTSSLSGVTGLTLQRTSTAEAVQLADVSTLAPGPYTVTLTTSQTAGGQNPDDAAALLAVFEFTKP